MCIYSLTGSRNRFDQMMIISIIRTRRVGPSILFKDFYNYMSSVSKYSLQKFVKLFLKFVMADFTDTKTSQHRMNIAIKS